MPQTDFYPHPHSKAIVKQLLKHPSAILTFIYFHTRIWEAFVRASLARLCNEDQSRVPAHIYKYYF